MKPPFNQYTRTFIKMSVGVSSRARVCVYTHYGGYLFPLNRWVLTARDPLHVLLHEARPWKACVLTIQLYNSELNRQASVMLLGVPWRSNERFIAFVSYFSWKFWPALWPRAPAPTNSFRHGASCVCAYICVSATRSNEFSNDMRIGLREGWCGWSPLPCSDSRDRHPFLTALSATQFSSCTLNRPIVRFKLNRMVLVWERDWWNARWHRFSCFDAIGEKQTVYEPTTPLPTLLPPSPAHRN